MERRVYKGKTKQNSILPSFFSNSSPIWFLPSFLFPKATPKDCRDKTSHRGQDISTGAGFSVPLFLQLHSKNTQGQGFYSHLGLRETGKK